MQTTHQYIDKYPISPDSGKLILGTIHPHDHNNFKLPFFYGNQLSIWAILNEAFPNELGNPISLKGILEFLSNQKIAISDTILECNRKNPTALDEDLIPTKLNYGLIEQIRQSSIGEIFFTSGFGKNNAFKLFYVDILKQQLTPEIKANRGLTLDAAIFGRPIQLTVLYSPARTANVGISKSKSYIAEKEKYSNSRRPVQDFKVAYYQKKFS